MFIANPDEEIGSPTSTPHIRALAADVDVVPGPRMRPRQRRHRVGAQGHPRPPHHRPRPRRARRRRAREGPQRDPRGGPDRRATCTRSTAAGRASPSTSASSPAAPARTSWPSAARSRSTSAPSTARRRSRPPRPRSGRSPPRPMVPDTTVEFEPMAALVADGEARAQRPARRARPGGRRGARLRGQRRLDRRRVRRQHDGRAWASRASTASGRSAATTTRPRSTSRSTRSCRGRRCSPGSCWPSRRDPEVLAWRDGRPRRLATRDRPPADLVGRAVGGRRRLQPGDRRRRRVLGRRAPPTPGRTARRATRATSRAQARAILEIIEAALGEAGFALADVVRTRMFVTDIDALGRGHRGPRRGLRRDPAGGDPGRGRAR